ncbi:MAG: 3-keto-disaccharide hydrolase [Planctomycetota bacterium]|jgi:hypothetical protein
MTPQRARQNSRYHLIKSSKSLTILLTLVAALVLTSCAAPERARWIQEAKEAIEGVDPVMGDWQGSMKSGSQIVAQVIALGDGEYQANLLSEFDKRIAPIAVFEGRTQEDGTVQFMEVAGGVVTAVIERGRFSGSVVGMVGGGFEMKKVYRPSPTLGARPPAGAVVLFDGENLDQWQHPKKPGPVQWKLLDGAMEAQRGAGSIITKRKFTDCELHLEFRTPFMPQARGQGRGNSGVYLQGRYEVQVLDSYGLEGRDNECGGIYKVAVPLVNMCAPPIQWQTYDITFHAPRFDLAGGKLKNARLTVLHNGVKIHDDVEAPKPTAAASDSKITEPGGIYLQDHGNPVQYRNIWLVELP